jgi:hypothetical protein
MACALTLALLAPPGAAAQEPQAQRPGRADAPPREEAWKLVDAYIISNLQESLGLSDEQFVKLLPLVKALQTGRRGFMQRRAELIAQMRRMLRSGEATETQIDGLMKQLRAVEMEEPENLRRQVAAIDAVLSPVQQAKFRILELEVERRIRELMQQMRRPANGRDRPDRRQPEPEPQASQPGPNDPS